MTGHLTTVDERQIRDHARMWSARDHGPEESYSDLFRSRFLEFAEVGPEIDSANSAVAAWAVLDRRLPAIAESLRKDLGNEEILGFWGLSDTWDDSIERSTIPPALNAIWSKLNPSNGVSHAGLAHTYGYLFNNDVGRFGSKRHRWTSGSVGLVLGLPQGWPFEGGSILASITERLMEIAPLDRRTRTSLPRSVELVADLRESGDQWSSRTLLLRRTDGTYDGESVLLIHSLETGSTSERFVTAFCQTESRAEEVINSIRNGPEMLRFNAAIWPI